MNQGYWIRYHDRSGRTTEKQPLRTLGYKIQDLCSSNRTCTIYVADVTGAIKTVTEIVDGNSTTRNAFVYPKEIGLAE